MSGEAPVEPHAAVELPAPTVAPLVLSLAVGLLAVGLATNLVFSLVGGVLLVVSLAMWIGQLLPGRGHIEEPLVEPGLRARMVVPAEGQVERVRRGMPGYRLRLPERVRPLSAGIKGGLVGGLVMPLPAMLYGMLSGHGIWLPINLLAGMALPGVDQLSLAELEQFRPVLFVAGAVLHVCVSLILGLIYGVLMPTLPEVPKPLSWGAVLMPLFWTALSFTALGIVNPSVRARIDWPWFVVSQFIFGIVAATVYLQWRKSNAVAAGLAGGIAGGVLMPIPALTWALLAGHTIWYPINLLSAMAVQHMRELSTAELEQFRTDWLAAAIVTHAVLSLAFGLAFGLVLPRIPAIPSPMVWGGLIMPLLWTASSYGLMGVVNPVLQQHVDWPWFVASQFVFGLVAAVVIYRAEQIPTPPAGQGREPFSQ